MLVSVGMKNCTGRPKAAILFELSEMQTNPTPSPQRLLVIKPGALGDIVQGFGAFASLRAGDLIMQSSSKVDWRNYELLFMIRK